MNFSDDELQKIKQLITDVKKWANYQGKKQPPVGFTALTFRRSIINTISKGLEPIFQKLRFVNNSLLLHKLESLQNELFKNVNNLPKNLKSDNDPILIPDFGLYCTASNLVQELEGMLIQSETKKGKKSGQSPKQENVIGLKAFIEKYCECHKGIDIASRRKALQDAHSKETIQLPDLVRPYKKGRENLYNAEDLIRNWGHYQTQVNLPPLK